MKILVTGGAGFIGSHLVEALLRKGEDICVVDDFNDFYDPSLKRENVAPFLENTRFTLYETDIRDRKAITRIIHDESPDVICHLAARAGVRPSIKDPHLYEEVNCLGTLNIVEAVKDRGIKNFVFASSSSVYGLNSKVPFSEDDPISAPVSPYAVTKRAGELMLHTYAHLYGIPTTCLRFFTVYGERGRPDMAVAKFTRLIWEGRKVPIYGDGTQKRDFTYIGDILKGLVNSIYTPFRYEIINLGGSRTVEVRRLVAIIEEKLGKKADIEYLPRVKGDVPQTYASVEKAKRLLRYEPEVMLEEGVERYVKWFIEREKRLGG